MPVCEEEVVDSVEVIPGAVEMGLVPREPCVEGIDDRLQLPVADVIVGCAMPVQRDSVVGIQLLPSSHVGLESSPLRRSPILPGDPL